MKLSFHGAAQTVTGSKHLLTLQNGRKLLLDCGLFQGLGASGDAMNRNFGFEASEVDWLVLSHAHIDHCGLIPKLVKEGFRGTVYCTPATRDLAEILLMDSAEIQRDDTRFINKKRAKKNLPPFEELYTIDDARQAIALFESRSYDEWFHIADAVEVLFTDAGHIIGSAAVNLRISEGERVTNITFSGDVGQYRDVILKSPAPFPAPDYLLLESTYGNRLHNDRRHTNDELLRWISHTCLTKKGKLIIPAFSVGRTQELLYALNTLEQEGRLPPVKYYVDSPLSREATAVVKSHPENFNATLEDALRHDKDIFDFKGLIYTGSADESKRINLVEEPCVIISASGMADAGRVKHHIRHNISNDKNTVLMVGYSEPASLAGQLLNGNSKVKIFGELFQVKAEIGSMQSMSAHGDYEDLLKFISGQRPDTLKKIFLVHGEYAVQKDFANRLTGLGFQVEIPGMHYAIEI
ncbi:MBL fold metallo-hydrolase [Segetibacter sp. 3557_3]|uniref:MBL fold metallo-hydrolase RNA specificity domain-containing protein n=1 Tax=Segetibacter sp. 3557_3 TaxID=2547429 RepID=UPI00105843EC|nr:MBL fold metallo-hydrolase [Segetibacter sp. 3557_3]TDH26054.1 MBL fold metallo-hydrolase [Segetibacter sp. 3557_3]